MRKSKLIGVVACAAAFASAGTATAATTEIVTEADVAREAQSASPTKNWVLSTNAVTPATAGAFVTGPGTPPLGTGSFRTTTGGVNEKVSLFNYTHVGKKLSAISQIDYSTYRTAGSLQQVAALNMVVDVNGPAAGGFTTLVYEPVYNTTQGSVVDGVWQSWSAEGSGVWWSTRAIPGVCAFDCFVPLSTIIAANPDATILGGVGVNQGSGNAGLTASTDAFTFDTTTYDFELVRDTDGDGVADGVDNCVNAPNAGQADGDGDGVGTACDPNERPASAEDCKKGGFAAYTTGPNRDPLYKNQGQCVSSFNGKS